MVSLQDLVNPSRTLQVHVSRCREYKSRPGEDLVQEAVRGSDLYTIEEIVSHKVLPLGRRKVVRPSDIELTVRWRGFSDTTTERLSNMSIRNSAAFVRYAQNQSILQPFIKTVLPETPPPLPTAP
jgi:hypothetical protein